MKARRELANLYASWKAVEHVHSGASHRISLVNGLNTRLETSVRQISRDHMVLGPTEVFIGHGWFLLSSECDSSGVLQSGTRYWADS